MTLAALQAAFASSLTARDESPPQDVSKPHGVIPGKRFAVYRNNVAASLSGVLRARFPVVARLVGEDFFWGAAMTFVSAHPARSPALFEYGEAFPAFLAEFAPVQALPYLPDVARLEWLLHAAYHAPDADPMDGAKLGEVPENTLGTVVLHLHPSAGIVVSDYPVFSIWQTNAMDAQVSRIGAEMGGEMALVLRPKLEVSAILLPPGGGVFISAISEGAGLATAAEKAAADAPEFALAVTLGKCLAAGAFTGCTLKGGVS